MYAGRWGGVRGAAATVRCSTMAATLRLALRGPRAERAQKRVEWQTRNSSAKPPADEQWRSCVESGLRRETLSGGGERCRYAHSLKSSNEYTSAQMKPFSKSVWMTPAAPGALVPDCATSANTTNKGTTRTHTQTSNAQYPR